MNREHLNGVGSLFRFITPILVTIAIFMVGQVWTQVNDLNMKMYHHATNDEIHTPKSEITALRTDILEMRRDIMTSIRAERESRR